ncbi:DNA mismatch repair protein MutL [Thermosipho sp. 1063]|uniref:DNA mismatch repair endonuclease MutL n=1 Tax=unclassified Thermosipho (in: thermotogales) TaxID=2676525 RepID=UPI0009492F08|nr:MULTISPECIES: DNA mismatch repair endonuclease MutL [unclassified Thermosipho (in: thermotogales)]ANQ53723.1 DNA mismatch repair protein MutL [Thermosipho sp. 1070]APT72169.1 DNA mismatch repair protein MutL [Thermosipho sp. 1063]OOC43410.1 DNA mismatch repair protein MutL [Thermosipho sp. 1074]
MAKIKKLDKNVISKIAAGEVVAGPFSVVKELVENALDARAKKIEVEIQNGGKSYIKVKDNGEGMSKDDLLLSVEEHTTSKIKDFEDIYTLYSFGFRGEALSSISKVSRVVITSNNGEESHRLEVIGGKIKKIEEFPTIERGTTVEVLDLFFNVPARRKFLKSAAVEKRRVIEFVEKFLLSNPEVSFTLKSDGDVLYNAESSSLEERFKLIFPEVREFTNINGKFVNGIISSPNYYRKNRTGQIFFVQKRYVVDKMLYHVFENGYGESLVNHPYGVLFIDLPPKYVDVNVHPQKLEVKFSDPNAIYSDIIRTVRNALKKFISKKIFVSDKKFEVKERHLNYINRQKVENEIPKNQIFQTLFDIERRNLEVKRDVIILRKRYVLFESEDGIYIMDFHAAHERILYEDILKKLNEKVDVLDLMIPIEVKFGKSFLSIASERKNDFEKFGFDIKIEDDSIKILSVPSFIKPSNVEEVLREILDEFRLPGDSPKNMKHIIADKACKSAVKTGYDITESEAKKLVEEVLKRGLTTCPHGRPLFLKLTFHELDSYFERI